MGVAGCEHAASRPLPASPQRCFPYERKMDGLQAALAGLPTAGVYVVGAALAAALGGAGFVGGEAIAPGALQHRWQWKRAAGRQAGAPRAAAVQLQALLTTPPPARLPPPAAAHGMTLLPANPPASPAEGLKQAAKYASAAVGAALGAFATKHLASVRQSAAIIELSNLLVGLGDPTKLTRDMVAGVEAKYGCSLVVTCPEEVKALYGTFVEAAVPPGDAPLTGREPELIQVRCLVAPPGWLAARAGHAVLCCRCRCCLATAVVQGWARRASGTGAGTALEHTRLTRPRRAAPALGPRRASRPRWG